MALLTVTNAEGGLRASSNTNNIVDVDQSLPASEDTVVTITLPTPYVNVTEYVQDMIFYSTGSTGVQEDAGEGGVERKLDTSKCSAAAKPGVCSDCNGDGCGMFHCSAFTHWTCPEGWKFCGFEDTCAFSCPPKQWCDPM